MRRAVVLLLSPYGWRRALGVDVAETADERARGLSGRRFGPEYAMWFAFERDGRVPFVTGEMLQPIDIVFMDRFGVVGEILRRVAPGQTAFPRQAYRHVLETYAGTTERLGIDRGSALTLA